MSRLTLFLIIEVQKWGKKASISRTQCTRHPRPLQGKYFAFMKPRPVKHMQYLRPSQEYPLYRDSGLEVTSRIILFKFVLIIRDKVESSLSAARSPQRNAAYDSYRPIASSYVKTAAKTVAATTQNPDISSTDCRRAPLVESLSSVPLGSVPLITTVFVPLTLPTWTSVGS